MYAMAALNTYSREAADEIYAAFLQAWPGYRNTHSLDELRQHEYGRLDEQDQVYLDYTGGGLYGDSQIRKHMELLRDHIFGNPHSNNPASLAITGLVQQARAYVLEYFHASPEEYAVIFTPNASGALKLVGESYPFEPGGRFLIATDVHNSVNGMREFARARGAAISYVPVTLPELRLDLGQLDASLAQADPAHFNLFVYPAQSNYSGVQHPLELIEQARARGWDVLVDVAAFVPTNRLDLSRWQPDFACLSFYKIFGYPTGIGALLARRTALAKLRRPWFAGGGVKIISVVADAYWRADGEAGFEDGTINYLSIPAVEIGLRHIEQTGIDAIHERVVCLTGWLLDQLTALRHTNGRPIVHVHGPTNVERRGGTITMSFSDAEGMPIFGQYMEHAAGQAGIDVRTGCFCNPGSGETTFQIPKALMKQFFAREEGMHFAELAREVYLARGVDVSVVRISVGMVTNFADVYRFMRFAAGFRDQTAGALGIEMPHGTRRVVVDTA